MPKPRLLLTAVLLLMLLAGCKESFKGPVIPDLSAEELAAYITQEFGIPCTYSKAEDSTTGRYTCEASFGDANPSTQVDIKINTDQKDGVFLFEAEFYPIDDADTYNHWRKLALDLAELNYTGNKPSGLQSWLTSNIPSYEHQEEDKITFGDYYTPGATWSYISMQNQFSVSFEPTY